eukprot:6971432-Prymnesium_polylepis.1
MLCVCACRCCVCVRVDVVCVRAHIAAGVLVLAAMRWGACVVCLRAETDRAAAAGGKLYYINLCARAVTTFSTPVLGYSNRYGIERVRLPLGTPQRRRQHEVLENETPETADGVPARG